jgi:hypothetical protein
MIARRLATAVVAVALIVGAFLIRRNVIEGGDDDADADEAAEPAAALVCITELEQVCAGLESQGIDVTIEHAGATLARLADRASVPLWLTVEPFPAMAGSMASSDVLAASKLAVAVPEGHRDVLTARCAGQALWRCVGGLAGEEWGDVPGRVEPSVGDAGRSAVALASFASAVAGYFDNAEFGSVELADPSLLPWVQRLVGAVPVQSLGARSPLTTMLPRPSLVNVAATSDAELAALDAPPGELESSYPEPSMWLQAVLAAPAGAEVPPDLAADAAAALRAAGWDRPEVATQPLPSATTMLALRQLWEDLQ